MQYKPQKYPVLAEGYPTWTTFSREFSLKKIRKDKGRRKLRIFSTLAHCF